MAEIPLSYIIFSTIFMLLVNCSPPEDPIKCTNNTKNCTVTNSYGAFPDRAICRAADVAYPTTEEELVVVVAAATKANRKMKAATRFSHSIPKLVCPDGDDGVLVSTKYLNRTLTVDKRSMRVTVESGVTLRQLIGVAAEAGLALPYAPYWWGLTIGGMMGTGAHGSTLWGLGSAVHDYVVRVRIVTAAKPEEGYATVRQLQEGDPEINAARVSLGVLDVISQVTLKLEPMFKRSITYVEKNDTNLGDEVAVFGSQHEFGDIKWHPSQRKVIYRFDDRVPTNTSGDGFYDSYGFRSTSSITLKTTRKTEEVQEAIRDANGKCINANIITSFFKNFAYGLTTVSVIFTGYPVIGYQNRLQSSGSCLDSPEDGLSTVCPWDSRIHGLFFHQTTFSISLSKVKGFIEDVQKLVNLQPKALCVLGLYDDILMRYVTASSAFLGKQDKAIDFDFTYYRSKDCVSVQKILIALLIKVISAEKEKYTRMQEFVLKCS